VGIDRPLAEMFRRLDVAAFQAGYKLSMTSLSVSLIGWRSRLRLCIDWGSSNRRKVLPLRRPQNWNFLRGALTSPRL
jgi:hypothetical protein